MVPDIQEMVQDGQEMVQEGQETFMKCQEISGNVQEMPGIGEQMSGNGQEMSGNGSKWLNLFSFFFSFFFVQIFPYSQVDRLFQMGHGAISSCMMVLCSSAEPRYKSQMPFKPV